MTMRSIGSISSELCEMQALRDSNLALGVKDLEWQRRIIGTRTLPYAPTIPTNLSPSSFPYFPTAPPSQLPAQHHQHPYQHQQPSPSPQPQPQPHPHPQFTTPGMHQLPTPIIPPPRDPSPVSSAPSSRDASGSTTHGALPDLDASERRRGDGCRKGRVGKIRRHRMTKEEEARFDTVDLRDLKGSTAAKSRKMTVEERDIMLHKRRLRNRQSAARSRDKQRRTIGDVGEEVEQLRRVAEKLRVRCETVEKDLEQLKNENEGLKKENLELKKSGLKRTPSFLHVSMSSDMLDKIISGEALGNGTGMLKIPSKLHLSVSTDKLGTAGDTWNASLPAMPRNASILERLLDLAGTADMGQSSEVATGFNSMTANSNSNQTTRA